MPGVTHLIRPAVTRLEPYTPIVPLDVLAERLGLPIEQLVKLDANENPYGPSPRVLAALTGATGHEGRPYYEIYPDPEQTRLRAALSAYSGQPAGRIVGGVGADELIDLLLRLFIDPGDAVIDCPPTFGMYPFDTAVCGGRLITVPRQADFSLDVAGIERAAAESGAKVLFLTSPNNPSGNLTPPEAIERLLRLPLLVVVDEAYIEFADSGNMQSVGVSAWVGHYENLAVLRTFSKWAGLAGMRLGYALLPEALAGQLWKIKQPYNLSLASEVAALASLDDLDYLRANVAKLVAERARLLAALRTLPMLEPIPSVANFILCRVVHGDALELKQRLARQGILVRHYSTPLLRGFIRVSVGTPEQTDRLIEALRANDTVTQ